jgi:hypothetical protein
MTAAPHLNPAQDKGSPKRRPAAERLESALGGDLTRFLLTALAAPPPAKPEPR